MISVYILVVFIIRNVIYIYAFTIRDQGH